MTDFADAAKAPYPVTQAERDAITAAIDPAELLDMALTLGNIPSRSREELAAATFVYDWMKAEGFRPHLSGATPERPNVIGEYGGQGAGANLLFTAHLDTESPSGNATQDQFRYRPATLAEPEWTRCWLENGQLYGYPISNDRGPMCCMLMAAKALKRAGIDLAGKVYLTACPGEIGPEPIEEFAGIDYMGKDIGAHYLFHHGGVAPDYAIAAEGTDFGMTWQGCGYAVMRIRILGRGLFTPILDTPEQATRHPNPIYRLGPVIEAIHKWSRAYEHNNIYTGPGGVSHPKAQIASVRGGSPIDFGAGTEICALYLEVIMTPQQGVAEIYHQLNAVLRTLDLEGFELEPVVVRHGFEADSTRVAPLAGAVNLATQLARHQPAAMAHPVYSSMWRDHNVFNMQRIPALTTGMPRWRPTPEDLASSALIYALTMLAICGRHEGPPAPAPRDGVYDDSPFPS